VVYLLNDIDAIFYTFLYQEEFRLQNKNNLHQSFKRL
jgi:hypothetical protein